MSRDEIFKEYILDIEGKYRLRETVPGINHVTFNPSFGCKTDAITAVQLAFKAASLMEWQVQNRIKAALGIFNRE